MLHFGSEGLPAGRQEYERTHPEIVFIPVNSFEAVESADALVFPSAKLSEYLDCIRGNTPFFCCGPVSHLRHALVLGASDFVKTPWDWQELHLRVNLRLSKRPAPSTPVYGLSWTESKLLECLLENSDGVVPRSRLEAVLGLSIPGSRALDVHISGLRKKLKNHFPGQGTDVLRSVRGKGYALEFLAHSLFTMVK